MSRTEAKALLSLVYLLFLVKPVCCLVHVSLSGRPSLESATAGMPAKCRVRSHRVQLQIVVVVVAAAAAAAAADVDSDDNDVKGPNSQDENNQ